MTWVPCWPEQDINENIKCAIISLLCVSIYTLTITCCHFICSSVCAFYFLFFCRLPLSVCNFLCWCGWCTPVWPLKLADLLAKWKSSHQKLISLTLFFLVTQFQKNGFLPPFCFTLFCLASSRFMLVSNTFLGHCNGLPYWLLADFQFSVKLF